MAWEQTECVKEIHPGSPEGSLYFGDNRYVDLSAYEGRVQCVYMDPPYLTGDSFVYRCRVGKEGWEKDKNTLILPAYDDRMDRPEYLDLLRQAVRKARELLDLSGVLFLHLNDRMSAYGRVICDEEMGAENFVNEIIWSYQTGGRSNRHFSRKHDVILFYRKSRQMFFDITKVPVPRSDNRRNHMKRLVDENGRSYRTIRSNGKIYTYYDDEPAYPSDVWTDVSHLQQKDPQRTGYDTQKPRALLDRIILSTTRPGDLVADLFCGSGTAMVSAAALGRRFLGVDLSPGAIQVSEKRLIPYGLTLNTVYGCPEAELRARLLPGIGLTDLFLEAYSAPGLPEFVQGLDGVERWSVGFLGLDGCFRSHASFTRNKLTPEIPEYMQIPQLNGRPAMVITDLLGRHTCWVWNGENTD